MTSSMRRRAAPMRRRHTAMSSDGPRHPIGQAVDVDVAALQLAQDDVELVEGLGVAGLVLPVSEIHRSSYVVLAVMDRRGWPSGRPRTA